jgi:hypothetical protein
MSRDVWNTSLRVTTLSIIKTHRGGGGAFFFWHMNNHLFFFWSPKWPPGGMGEGVPSIRHWGASFHSSASAASIAQLMSISLPYQPPSLPTLRHGTKLSPKSRPGPGRHTFLRELNVPLGRGIWRYAPFWICPKEKPTDLTYEPQILCPSQLGSNFALSPLSLRGFMYTRHSYKSNR